MRPPLQPLLKVLSQSINSCSDNDVRFPVTIWFIPSTATTVENAQQLPETTICPRQEQSTINNEQGP